MNETRAVHQCLFCPQTFGCAAEKDDHILEHFAQETCADCDQNLIRIGSNLYTIHNAVTCIKREVKLEINFLHEINNEPNNQNQEDGNIITTKAASDSDFFDIKFEPIEPEYEWVDGVEFKDTSYNYNSMDPSQREINSDTEMTSTNSLSIQQLEAESEMQCEQLSTVDMDSCIETCANETEPRQILGSEHHSTVSTKNLSKYKIRAYKYECEICNKSYPSPWKLGQHKKYSHSAPAKESEQFECEICQKTFDRPEYLRKHKRRVHDPNCVKYKCDICSYRCLSEESFKSHLARCKAMRTSDNSVVYSDESEAKYDRVPCDICGEKFLSCWLQRHKKLKHGIPDNVTDNFECDICKRVIKNEITLRQHMLLYHDPNCVKFKCEFCFMVFLSKDSLDNHLLLRCKRKNKSVNGSAHNIGFPGDDKRETHCELCNKKLIHSSLQKHMFSVHNTGGHICIHCKKVFFSAKSLLNHRSHCHKLLMHTFECYICRKAYTSKKYLKIHIGTIHTGLTSCKRFECEFCGKRFESKSACEHHTNSVHLNVRKHLCSTCGQAFADSSSLRIHEYIHAGIKPFQCTYEGCDKHFRTTTARSAHIRTNHRGEKRYRCRIDGCNEQFGGIVGFKKHKLNVHGIAMNK